MPRYRYDKDMECVIEIREGSNAPEPEKRARPNGIIRDIEPYRAMGSDVAFGGKRPIIGGRRQHREYLQRNGYVEIGNERAPSRSDAPSPREAQQHRVDAVKRAMGEYGSNTGTRG